MYIQQKSLFIEYDNQGFEGSFSLSHPLLKLARMSTGRKGGRSVAQSADET